MPPELAEAVGATLARAQTVVQAVVVLREALGDLQSLFGAVTR